MSETKGAPRVEPVPHDRWTAEQARILDPVLEAKGAYNILGTFVHHWEAYRAFTAFTAHVLGPNSTLAPAERELLILRTGWVCRAEYEWAQHKPQALAAGLTEAETERIKLGPDAAGWTPAQAAILRAVDQLVEGKTIGDAVWSELTSLLSTRQIFDLIFCVGQYATVAMLANACRVQLDPGFSGF